MTKTLFSPLLGNDGPGRIGVRVADLKAWIGGPLPATAPNVGEYETAQLEALLQAIHAGVLKSFGADEIEAAEQERTAAELSVPPAIRHLERPARLPPTIATKINRVLMAAAAVEGVDETLRECIDEGDYTSALHVLGCDAAGKWREHMQEAFKTGKLQPIDVHTGFALTWPVVAGSSDAGKRWTTERVAEMQAYKDKHEEPEWKEQARDEARRIRKERAAKGRFPSLEVLGEEVAGLFLGRGIVGPNGHPLAGATIKRQALQGHGITTDAAKLRHTLNKRGK